MHVFVNSQGAGLAANGGKFVAASQQYLQVSKVRMLNNFTGTRQKSERILVL